MTDVNKVVILGNFVREPRMRIRGDRSCAMVSVATAANYRMPGGKGFGKTPTQFHHITAWGRLAEALGKYAKKGDKVYIDGQLRHSQWRDKTGDSKYFTTVVAKSVVFLGSRKKNPTPVMADVGELHDEDEEDDENAPF